MSEPLHSTEHGNLTPKRVASDMFIRVSNRNPGSARAQAAGAALELKTPNLPFSAQDLKNSLLADPIEITKLTKIAINRHQRKGVTTNPDPITEDDTRNIITNVFDYAEHIQNLPADDLRAIINRYNELREKNTEPLHREARLNQFINQLLTAKQLPPLAFLGIIN